MTTETFQNTPTLPTLEEKTDADFKEVVLSVSRKIKEAPLSVRQASYDYFMSRWGAEAEPLARKICFGDENYLPGRIAP